MHRPGPRRDAARVWDETESIAMPHDLGSLVDGSSDAALPAELPQLLAGPLSACVGRVRHNTPPELEGALDTIEYGAVAEDACRIDLATSMRARELCDGIVLSVLREACAVRVAMASGRPDDCPRALGDRGREPTCVAIASRMPGLCAAALPSDALSCLAIAHADATSCETMDTTLRARCRRDVLAMSGVLPRMPGRPLPPGTAHLRLELGAAPDGGAAHVDEYDLGDFARGVYLGRDGTLYLVDPVYGWPGEFTVRPLGEHPVLGFALTAGRRVGPGTVVDFQIVLPNGMVIRRGGPTSSASVMFTELPRGRGSPVSASLVADGYATAVPVRVELTVHTFVRDVVDRASLF